MFTMREMYVYLEKFSKRFRCRFERFFVSVGYYVVISKTSLRAYYTWNILVFV